MKYGVQQTMKTAAIAIHSFAKRLLFNVIFRRLLSRTLLNVKKKPGVYAAVCIVI
jgi:hypothetical protein